MKKELYITISIYDIVLVLICLFSISTITQTLLPFSMNRFITLFIVAIIVFDDLFHLERFTCLIYVYIVFMLVYSMIWANDLAQNIEDYIYYTVAIVELGFFSKKEHIEGFQKSLQKNISMVKIVAIIDLVIVLISMFSPSCYQSNWSSSYLYGYTNSGHAMAAGCCLVMVLWGYIIANYKFSIIKIIPLIILAYAVLKTGARVFMVPIAIILYYYVRNQFNNKYIRVLILICGIVLFLFLIVNSNMLDKFMHATNTQGGRYSVLEALTSGRSEFWVVDILDYVNSGVLYQLFGRGFDYIYDLNAQMVGMAIWAHNDFINILIACGLVGLAIYIMMISKVLDRHVRKKDFMNKMMIMCYVLFPAFINGFYTYYHYFNSFIIFLMMVKVIQDKQNSIWIGER